MADVKFARGADWSRIPIVDGQILFNPVEGKLALDVGAQRYPLSDHGKLAEIFAFYQKNAALADGAYNLAVLRETRGGIAYVDLWLLVNATYDAASGRFRRVDQDNTAFGVQLQAAGTYAGEEGFGDFANQGLNVWRCVGRKILLATGDTATAALVSDEIGQEVNGAWTTYGVTLGWCNCFMLDSYGGMTIGGGGFEIDGNGILPFTRVGLGKFQGGSALLPTPSDYAFIYTGRLWNAFHGLVGADVPTQASWFYGLQAPVQYADEQGNPEPQSNRALTRDGKFVVKYLPPSTPSYCENWVEAMSVDRNGDMELAGDLRLGGKSVARALPAKSLRVSRQGDVCAFTFPYGKNGTYRIEFDRLGVNRIVHPKRFYKNDVLIFTTDTDWVGPYWLVRATDVDTPIPTACNCVGGNHGTNSSGGFPTAVSVETTVYADGIAVADGETVDAYTARLVTKNHISAGNRIDVRTGEKTASLEEVVTYTITPGGMEVLVYLTALENLQIGNGVVGGYCGLQIPGYMFPRGSVYFGDQIPYAIGDGTLREYTGTNDRAVLLSGAEEAADAVILYTNRLSGLGDRRHFLNGSPGYYKAAFDKVYGHLIWREIALAAGESAFYSGGYTFAPLTATSGGANVKAYPIRYNGFVEYCVDFLDAVAEAYVAMPEGALGKQIAIVEKSDTVSVDTAIGGKGLKVSSTGRGTLKYRLYDEDDRAIGIASEAITAATDAKLAQKLDAAAVDNFTILTRGALVAQTAEFSARQDMIFTMNGFAWKFRKSYLRGAKIVEMYVCVEQACTLYLGVLTAVGWNTSFAYYVERDVLSDGWYQMVLPDDLPDVFWLGFYVSAGRCVPPSVRTRDAAWPDTPGDDDNCVYTGYPGRPLGVDWYLMWSGYDPAMRFYADTETVPDMQRVVDYVEAAQTLIRAGRSSITLPYRLFAVRGDYLEVFRKSVIYAANAEAMGWNAEGAYGICRKRLWRYDVGAWDWEGEEVFSLYDAVGNIVDKRTVFVKIVDAKTSPASAKAILCVGDDYTVNGAWVAELMRRLTGTGGTPAGLGLGNLATIGTDASGDTRYVGKTNMTLADYIGSSSPFYNASTAALDFAGYCSENGFAGIDYCFIFLGHNDYDLDDLTVRARMATLLDAIHSAYPNAQIALMGLVPPNEDARGGGYLYALKRGQAISTVYKMLAAEITYASFVTYTDTGAQFDAEYGYPTSTEPVNARSSLSYRRATGDAALSAAGAGQVADAAYRVFHALP